MNHFQISMTEALGFATGASCVYLTLRENMWNFPIGLANNMFFLALFLRGRLFGDAGLQIVYMLLGLQGWYQWRFGGESRTVLRVTRTSPRLLSLVGGFIVLATACLAMFLRSVKDAAPVLDAFTTVLSLGAQYLLNRKAIENWSLWFLADLIYVYLYISRGLLLTAILYGVFACLCVAGLLAWWRSLQQVESVTVG